MIDHQMMHGFKFKFGGTDILPLIREQVEAVRNRFGGLFGVEKIPILDDKYRL
jgi:hypothetical protein